MKELYEEEPEVDETKAGNRDINNNEISYECDFYSNEEITSKEIADAVHDETKRDMMEEHGDVMNESQREMLDSDETKDHLNVISSQEYVDRFEEVPFNVVGHCDKEGNIFIKDISMPVVEHVSVHETMHLCADRQEINMENGNTKLVSGLRETTFHEDGRITDKNEKINEGITEMYTMRELRSQELDDACESIVSYPEARVWAERLEKLVGQENVEAAYFGTDKKSIEKEFNRLSGNDESAWNRFSKDIDVVENSQDMDEIRHAKERLFVQYKTIYMNKYMD